VIPLETDPERRKLAIAYIRSADENLDAIHFVRLELAAVASSETTKRAVLGAALRMLESKLDNYLGLIQHNLNPMEPPHEQQQPEPTE
jgi:hypothetical protein